MINKTVLLIFKNENFHPTVFVSLKFVFLGNLINGLRTPETFIRQTTYGNSVFNKIIVNGFTAQGGNIFDIKFFLTANVALNFDF